MRILPFYFCPSPHFLFIISTPIKRSSSWFPSFPSKFHAFSSWFPAFPTLFLCSQPDSLYFQDYSLHSHPDSLHSDHSYPQSFTRYLRSLVFMSNSALREKFNFCFFKSFLLVLIKFLFWQEDWAPGYHSMTFRHLPDIPNFLRS